MILKSGFKPLRPPQMLHRLKAKATEKFRALLVWKNWHEIEKQSQHSPTPIVICFPEI
jgi:hypothetical protein